MIKLCSKCSMASGKVQPPTRKYWLINEDAARPIIKKAGICCRILILRRDTALKSNPAAMTLVNVKKAVGSMSKETTA